ncbi:hypothetical protein PC111_g13723 [Phytophthora cactorum]|nr:hypothetical protein PC111_g13723 [Phytophthora cactorum]
MTLPKTLFSIFSLVVAFQGASGIEYTDTGIAIVGTTEPLNVNVTAGTSREDLISYEFASYIAVHFAGFNLPEGDSVVISSPDDNVTVSHTYTGRGRDQTGTFIASFVSGNSVTVTYTSVGIVGAGQGYRITGFSRGYPTMQHESVCGDGDQSLPAKCYAPGTNLSDGLPEAYTKAQAVARLLINGTYLCTGWLGGSEGHLFTNHHCFEQEDWALTTDIEFAAESSSCSEQCETQLGCPGKLVATTSTLIADSEDIDYSVVQLPDCVDLSPYGYLQMRESGPVVNESIYVPQHPDGYAKRIVSTTDNGDSTTVLSVGQDGNCGTEQVGHDADTQGGSSGSPLIASSDNLVVGIHHCGGCANTAIDVRTVLTDLASKNITIKNLVASENVGQSSPPAYAQTPCAAQKPKNSTPSGQNHTMPCHGSSNTNLTSTSTVTVTSNVTTSNSSITTPSSSPTSSPLATAAASTAASQSNSSPSTATTTTSTVTSNTAALTSASVVTSTKPTSWSLSDTATTPVDTVTSTSSSNTTTITGTNATSTSTTVKTASRRLADCDSTPASTPSTTSATDTVDNNTIVGGISPECTSGPTPVASVTTTPKPTKPSSTPAATVTTTPKPTTPSSTPAATVTTTPKPTTPSLTPAASVTTTPKPTTPSSTPAATVTTTPKPTTPSLTPAASVTTTPKPTTPSSTPAATVTTTPKPTTPSLTPAASVTTTPKPTKPSSTPAATVTTTPKPTTPSLTPAASVTTTPTPTTPSSTPAATVTTTPQPTTPSLTPAASVTTTPKPTKPSSTPAATVTTTPKPTTPSLTPAAMFSSSSTSVSSSSGGWGDVEQN